MRIRDMHTLDKTLLNSDFETARALYELARGQGHAPLKAAALVYRHGYLDGRDSNKEKVSEAYKRLSQERKVTGILAEVDRAAKEPDVADEGSEVSSDE